MTLGTHLDPDLARARAQAARTLRGRLLEAGWPPEVADGLARVAAEVCVASAFSELKRAWRRSNRDKESQ